jgi:hypothetical protein
MSALSGTTREPGASTLNSSAAAANPTVPLASATASTGSVPAGMLASVPVGAPQPNTGTFRALRHRNFQLYLGGQLVSLAGTWMQNIAQGWLVYQISGSTVMLGVVGFAAAIPAFLIAPWAGVVVDRVNKRNLLVATQAILHRSGPGVARRRPGRLAGRSQLV